MGEEYEHLVGAILIVFEPIVEKQVVYILLRA